MALRRALHRAEDFQPHGRGAGLLVNGLRAAAGLGLILSCTALIPDDEAEWRAEDRAGTAEAEDSAGEASASRDAHLAAAAVTAEVIKADARTAAALCNGCSLDGSNYGTNRVDLHAGWVGNNMPMPATARSQDAQDAQMPSAAAAMNGAAMGSGSASPTTDVPQATLALAAAPSLSPSPSPSISTGYGRPEEPTTGLPDTMPASSPESYTPVRVAMNELYAQPESTPSSISPATIASALGPSTPSAMSNDPSGFIPATAFDPGRLAAASPVYRREAPMRGGGDLPKGIEATKAVDATKGVDTAKGADPAKSIDTARAADPAKGTDTAKGIDTAKGVDTAKAVDTTKGADTDKLADPAREIDTLKTSAEPSTSATASPSVTPSDARETVAVLARSGPAPAGNMETLPSLANVATKTWGEIGGIERPDYIPGGPLTAPPVSGGTPHLVDRLIGAGPSGNTNCCDWTTTGGSNPPATSSGPVEVLFSGRTSPTEHIVDTTQTPSTPTTSSFLQPATDLAISAPTALLAAVVPEPSTLALLGIALWGLASSSSGRGRRTIVSAQSAEGLRVN